VRVALVRTACSSASCGLSNFAKNLFCNMCVDVEGLHFPQRFAVSVISQ
jgi:hypothetical protein